jgi:hypothetical protein
MPISANYSIPVQVNGFSCKNCTDVALAKKHIDPAHPRSGPYGINAKTDPTVSKNAAVAFGGALGGLNTKSNTDNANPSPDVTTPQSEQTAAGTQLDIQV